MPSKIMVSVVVLQEWHTVLDTSGLSPLKVPPDMKVQCIPDLCFDIRNEGGSICFMSNAPDSDWCDLQPGSDHTVEVVRLECASLESAQVWNTVTSLKKKEALVVASVDGLVTGALATDLCSTLDLPRLAAILRNPDGVPAVIEEAFAPLLKHFPDEYPLVDIEMFDHKADDALLDDDPDELPATPPARDETPPFLRAAAADVQQPVRAFDDFVASFDEHMRDDIRESFDESIWRTLIITPNKIVAIEGAMTIKNLQYLVETKQALLMVDGSRHRLTGTRDTPIVAGISIQLDNPFGYARTVFFHGRSSNEKTDDDTRRKRMRHRNNALLNLRYR